MSRIYSHLNTAKTILQHYKGDLPFSLFLKNFFSKEKKYGSRDRKNISSLCYNYFRLGSAYDEYSIDERLLAGTFLSTHSPNEWLQSEKPEWNDNISLPLKDKLSSLSIHPNTIFPFNSELSKDIDVDEFGISFLIQPDVFIRVRPGKQQVVKSRLINSKVSFKEINENCYAFENATKLEDIIDINKDAVIQDASSQAVGSFLLQAQIERSGKVWDCCAASGGKAIMAADLLNDIKLTVSDVRPSIIHNLHARFREAELKDYRSFVADLTSSDVLRSSLKNTLFDLIICDAPCSGSGTWSRTPEQLVFFKEGEITRYSNLQKAIAMNALSYLKKGGYFLYITCSVFKKENEEVVAFLQDETSLSLVEMKMLKGYGIKADTMFAALFIFK